MTTRTLPALAAFPLGWAARETAGGGVGGVVVLGLIAAAAWGLARPRALGVVLTGIACFAGVHLLAGATTVYTGLAVGAVIFALAVWWWAR